MTLQSPVALTVRRYNTVGIPAEELLDARMAVESVFHALQVSIPPARVAM